MSTEDPICRRCETEYALRSDSEDSGFCDECAHTVLIGLRKVLKELKEVYGPREEVSQ